MNSSIDVSLVVYKHTESSIATVVNSLFHAAMYAELNKLKLTIIDNNGGFLFSTFIALIEPKFQFLTESIRYIKRDDNPGYSISNNLAIFTDNSKYHLILNPDVYLSEGSIRNALTYFNENPKCIMITPRILDEYDNIISGVKSYPSILTLAIRFLDLKILNKLFKKRLNSYDRMDVINSNKPSTVEIASGCCMFVRKNKLCSVGGFSEIYFLYFEDFDLCIKLNKIGNIDYVPNCLIRHLGGNAGKKGFLHIKFFVISMVRFFCLHGFKWF